MLDAPPLSALSSGAARLAADAGAVRLNDSFKKLFKEMPRLGVISCQTNNPVVRQERIGPCRWVRFLGNAGQTGGPEVDLRLFLQNWRSAFAVRRPGEAERAFRFLGRRGELLLEFALLPQSDASAFERIVEKYRSPDPSRPLPIEPAGPRREKPDAEVDVAAFQRKWRKMWDTHQFFSLHRKFGLHRLQALRLGPPEMVRAVRTDSARRLFEAAARRETAFMTFSGNAGCLQIHKEVARQLSDEDGWFHVREDGFHLRIHEPSVAFAFEVRKPTIFGVVSSLELFDAAGENVAVFYGKRRRIEAEHADWRELLAALPGA